jgi:transcriptional regulator with XRE-family HTH domain
MSQRRLAAKAGVSQAVISRLERGVAHGLAAMRLVTIGMALGPNFPFGCCGHDHPCAFPYNPAESARPRPNHGLLPGDR